MALEACRECKSEVSTTAQACPSCGARLPTPTSSFVAVDNLMIAAAIGLAAFAYFHYF